MKRPPENLPSVRVQHIGAGVLRPVVLTVGIFYLAMALSEILLGSEGLIVRNRQILLFANVQNLIHWGVGVGLVLGGVAGRRPARAAAIIGALGLAGFAAAGALARHRVGGWLGFESALPFAYDVIHALTGFDAYHTIPSGELGKSEKASISKERLNACVITLKSFEFPTSRPMAGGQLPRRASPLTGVGRLAP